MAVEFTDVVVIGAGPAGAAASIHLASSGLKSVLLDKATFPRPKICGDGLTAMAIRELRRLRFPSDNADLDRSVLRAVVESADGRSLALDLSGGSYFSTIRRVELDHRLVKHAISSGVDLRDGTQIVGLRRSASGFEIELNGSRIVATYLIVADGAYSPAARMLSDADSQSPKFSIQAVRRYEGQTSPAAKVTFDATIRPGYVWSFPMSDSQANNGIMIHRPYFGATGGISRLFDRILPPLPGADSNRSWPIPTIRDGLRLTVGGALVAGDAARLADPLTGEGIGQALLSGRLAATAILPGGDVRTVAKRYEVLAYRHLILDLRASNAILPLLTHRRGLSIGLGFLNSAPILRNIFAAWMFEKAPRLAAPATIRRALAQVQPGPER